MARPRSADRRNTILAAATHVVAAQGLAAATAAIAKEAGVSNGSLFVYFDTKSALLNELYVTLKADMGAAAVAGLPPDAEPREQLRHMWTRWLHWATTQPEKHRTLAHLEVSDDISADSHAVASAALGGIAEILRRCLADGPMRDVPLGFVLALANAMADATIAAMVREPDAATDRADVAFDAIWRVFAGSTP